MLRWGPGHAAWHLKAQSHAVCASCSLQGGKQTVSQCIRQPQMYRLLRWESPLQFPGGKPRSLEDLKARYYAVARQLLVGREGAEDCVANHVLIKHPFNPVHERWGQAAGRDVFQ